MGLFEHTQRSPAVTPPAAPGQARPGAFPVRGALSAESGRPLDAATRAPFERGLGVDFSRVRVHDGPRASESARALRALAYTVGSDIVFRDGAFAPHTLRGQRLLAHELAHVAQQTASGSVRPFPSVAAPDAPAERAAEQAAEAVVRGAPVPRVWPGAGAAIHRTPDPTHGTEALHDDLVEEYRRAMGYPPRGIGPAGERVGPTDAEIRFSLLEPWLVRNRPSAPTTPHGSALGGSPAPPATVAPQPAPAAGPASARPPAVAAPPAVAQAAPAATPAGRYDPAHPPAWAMGPWADPDGTPRQTPRGYGRNPGWYDPHVPVVPSGPAVPGNLPPGARGTHDGLRWAFYGDEIRAQQRIPWNQVVGGRTGRRVALRDPAAATDADGTPVDHDSHGIVQAAGRDARGVIVGDQGWLHNNPGEMRGGGVPTRGDHARRTFRGALGVGEGNSVVFGSEAEGHEAMREVMRSSGTESFAHRMCRWDTTAGNCDRFFAAEAAEEARLRRLHPASAERRATEMSAWYRSRRVPAYLRRARRILEQHGASASASLGSLAPGAQTGVVDDMADFVSRNETPSHGHVYSRGDTNLPPWVRDIFVRSPSP